MEEEFGAEVTGGARVCDGARGLGMLWRRVADVAEGRHLGQEYEEVDRKGVVRGTFIRRVSGKIGISFYL